MAQTVSRFRGMELAQLGLPPSCLQGQTAIVTGGGRGIGKELCLILARLGASVVIAEISAAGKAVETEVRAAGAKGLYVQTDVASQESVAQMVAEAKAAFGSADILVNNAIYCPVSSLAEMDVQTWDRVMAVNLRGSFLCTKHVLADMLTKGKGTIVNLYSAPSMPYLSAYTCTKQAVESLAHSLAGEVEGKAIHVVAYGPGMVETPGGVEAFRKLAAIYGMSYEEFTHSGVNPGYEGLIPPYDSALALAYVISHAAQYHEQSVMMSEVADKMLSWAAENTPELANTQVARISSGSGSGSGDNRRPEPSPRPQTPAGADTQVLEKARQLRDILAETEAEFRRLPFFARPMARTGFKRKAGMSVADLQQSADELISLGERMMAAASPDADRTGPSASTTSVTSRYRSMQARLLQSLPGLTTYYLEVPAETARFVKDQETLAAITRVSHRRAEVCQQLQAAALGVPEPPSD